MAGRHVPDDFKRWQNELLFQTLERKKNPKRKPEKLTFNLATSRLGFGSVEWITPNAYLRRRGQKIHQKKPPSTRFPPKRGLRAQTQSAGFINETLAVEFFPGIKSR